MLYQPSCKYNTQKMKHYRMLDSYIGPLRRWYGEIVVKNEAVRIEHQVSESTESLS